MALETLDDTHQTMPSRPVTKTMSIRYVVCATGTNVIGFRLLYVSSTNSRYHGVRVCRALSCCSASPLLLASSELVLSSRVSY